MPQYYSKAGDKVTEKDGFVAVKRVDKWAGDEPFGIHQGAHYQTWLMESPGTKATHKDRDSVLKWMAEIGVAGSPTL